MSVAKVTELCRTSRTTHPGSSPMSRGCDRRWESRRLDRLSKDWPRHSTFGGRSPNRDLVNRCDRCTSAHPVLRAPSPKTKRPLDE